MSRLRVPGEDPYERIERLKTLADRMRREGERQYPGRVARSTGLPKESDRRVAGDVVRTPVDFGELEPIQKRTEREQLESLTKRVVETFTGLGYIPESVMKEVRTVVKLKTGRDFTTDDLQKIAGHYLAQAHREEEARQQRLVARTKV